jgi:3-methyladenine DNA glycosylase AlkD
MTVKEILKRLEALGDEKVRTLNIRNGAGTHQFGVKLGDLRVLAKQLGTDQELAMGLWETGNLDARLLAILLMKPKAVSPAEMERMVRSIGVAQVAEWLISYVVKAHPEKETLRQRWMKVKYAQDPWSARAAWSLTSERVSRSPEGLDLAGLLDRIESEMAGAPAEVQWTMNACLANIGIHHPKHRKRALAIGESLGVYRDYPVSKGCTSPFAPIWIEEMVKRKG